MKYNFKEGNRKIGTMIAKYILIPKADGRSVKYLNP
jgi:hypothetical protein